MISPVNVKCKDNETFVWNLLLLFSMNPVFIQKHNIMVLKENTVYFEGILITISQKNNYYGCFNSPL